MITATLPFPPSALFPNRARTKHWTKNAAAAQLYKSLCAIELREQGIGKVDADRVALDIVFCPPDRRHRDLDGLLSACKGLCDMLAMALGVDDRHFEPITLRRGEVVPKGEVRITVYKA